MILKSLAPKEYNPYYSRYIELASNENIVEGLKYNLNSLVEFYLSIREDKHNYAYAAGKWTIKDVLLHCIDVERIFTYRALRIARNDKTALAGFDQDDYVLNGNSDHRSLDSLITEYKASRCSTITLFESLDANALSIVGEASGSPISVRALGYIITGHENHHVNIIKERYL